MKDRTKRKRTSTEGDKSVKTIKRAVIPRLTSDVAHDKFELFPIYIYHQGSLSAMQYRRNSRDLLKM